MAKEKHYDRVKAIKKASRADAGPPRRKADAHTERRAECMSTGDWLAEAEEEMTDYFPTESGTLNLADVVRNSFPWNLHDGSEVFWNNPDDGMCSRHIVIHKIEFHGAKGDPDCILRITGVDGDFVECFARELS